MSSAVAVKDPDTIRPGERAELRTLVRLRINWARSKPDSMRRRDGEHGGCNPAGKART
jgi:hypothetical protein